MFYSQNEDYSPIRRTETKANGFQFFSKNIGSTVKESAYNERAGQVYYKALLDQ